jgi:nucleoside-diphosphate-sugar epimerase
MQRLEPGCAVFNAADAEQLSSRQIAETIAAALGVRLRGLRLPRDLACALASPLDVVARVTGRNLPITAFRIRKFTSSTIHLAPALAALGFVPPVAPRDGLARMAAWFRAYTASGARDG